MPNAKWQMPKLQNKQNISIVHKIAELFSTVANPLKCQMPNGRCQKAQNNRIYEHCGIIVIYSKFTAKQKL